jgi:hypothetical protein
MKALSVFSLLVGLVLPVSAAHAQVLTTVGSETNGSTLPGSPSEYIIFNGSNYNEVGGDAAGSYKNLPDFEIVGGESQYGGDSGFSTINTPGGAASQRTGGIVSTNTIAVGLELLGTISPTGFASDGFNFNDFNIYVAVDNALSADGAFTAYNPNATIYDDTSVGLDARLDNVELTPVSAPITSHNTSLSAADYVEFNVTGLGTAVAASEAAHPGTNNDLVLRIFKPDGDDAVLGGISFESAPEPPTWAMMFVGAAGLLFAFRRAKSSV